MIRWSLNLDLHKKTQLLDKSESTRTENVRPIGFLELLHSSPPLPTGRQAQDGAFCGILVSFLLIYFNDNSDGVSNFFMEVVQRLIHFFQWKSFRNRF